MPRVSIIIPTYNCKAFLVKAVGSVLRQTYTDHETVVVDDGSTDGTAEALAPYFDSIRLIRQDNSGTSAARNRGILESRGELVAFLDHDDLWEPEKLDRYTHAFDERPEVGVVYGNYGLIDANGETMSPIEVERDSYFGHKPSGMVYEEFLKAFYGRPSTVMVRRDCFARAGLFDPFIDSVEDWDMWIRLARHFQFLHIPEVLAYCRFHGSSASKDTGKVAETMDRLFAKHEALSANDPKALAILRRTRRYVPSEQQLRRSYHLQASGEWRAALPHLLKALTIRKELWRNPFFVKCTLNSLLSRKGGPPRLG